MRTGPALLRRPEDLTPDWLTEALAGSDVLRPGESIDSFNIEPVGTGQMADTVRIGWQVGAATLRPVR